jgi:ATP-binding cassette subfamily F protein 3
MMFSGDDAEKKVGVLSGGERSRVLLGKLLTAPSNLLFLDEPTHHLDIESCQAMMDAVRDFEGAALVVAHDERFLHEVATKLIVFKNDKVFFYHGGYKEFLERIGWDEDDEPFVPAENPPKSGTRGHTGKMERKARAEFNAMKYGTLRPLEKRIEALEREIMDREERSRALNQELVTASLKKGGMEAIRRNEIGRELKALLDEIDLSYKRLDAAMTEYDSAKRQFGGE